MDLAALAAAGAATLVTAMTTDLWSALRGRVAKLWAADGLTTEDAALAQLDSAQEAVRQASDDTERTMTQVELRGMLRARLVADPTVAEQFAALVDEVRAQVAETGPAPSVRQEARADRGATVIQAGRDVHRGSSRP